MPDAIETHRSFVNTWECDENQHMNVQFYAKRFEEALQVFSIMTATGGGARLVCRDRHLRFHVELNAGATTLTRSAIVADGPHAGRVVHRLYHSETGALCATALDRVERVREGAPTVPCEEVAPALPRSIQDEPLAPMRPQALVELGGVAANFAVLTAADCDAEGRILERMVVGRFSDGAPHAWKAGGVDVNWLLGRQLGRVAVEMKITRHSDMVEPGDVLALYSAPVASSGKTVTLRHELVRLATGEAVAGGEVVALIIDLKTRRPTALPDSVVARLQAAS